MKHNRADIKRETYEDHPMQQNARHHIQMAGIAVGPFGFDYEASAVVHYFKKPGTTDYVFAVQLVDFDRIPEGQADVGHKELQKALMKAYGRGDGRRKDTREEMI